MVKKNVELRKRKHILNVKSKSTSRSTSKLNRKGKSSNIIKIIKKHKKIIIMITSLLGLLGLYIKLKSNNNILNLVKQPVQNDDCEQRLLTLSKNIRNEFTSKEQELIELKRIIEGMKGNEDKLKQCDNEVLKLRAAELRLINDLNKYVNDIKILEQSKIDLNNQLNTCITNKEASDNRVKELLQKLNVSVVDGDTFYSTENV